MYERAFDPLPEKCRLEDYYSKRDAVAAACQQIKTEHQQTTGRWADKFKVSFAEDVTIHFNYRKQLAGCTFNLKFFISAGMLCYTFFKRSGWQVTKTMIEKMTRIKLITYEERREEKRKQVKYIRGIIHPNAWPELTEALTDPHKVDKYIRNYGLNLIDIRKRFCKQDCQKIEEAFREKKELHVFRPGTRRDISVNTKICNDGIFRAWYSSEYAGRGNGQYYLLINPHYATFMEPD